MAPTRFISAACAFAFAFTALTNAAVPGVTSCDDATPCGNGMVCVSSVCACDQANGYSVGTDNACHITCATGAAGANNTATSSTYCKEGKLAECKADGTYKCNECAGEQFKLDENTKQCSIACPLPHCHPDKLSCRSVEDPTSGACNTNDGCEEGYKTDNNFKCVVDTSCTKEDSKNCRAHQLCVIPNGQTDGECTCDVSKGYKLDDQAEGECINVCQTLNCEECNATAPSKCTKCEDGYYGDDCESCPTNTEETQCVRATCTNATDITCVQCVNQGYEIVSGKCVPGAECLAELEGCNPDKSTCTWSTGSEGQKGHGSAFCFECLSSYTPDGLGRCQKKEVTPTIADAETITSTTSTVQKPDPTTTTISTISNPGTPTTPTTTSEHPDTTTTTISNPGTTTTTQSSSGKDSGAAVSSPFVGVLIASLGAIAGMFL